MSRGGPTIRRGKSSGDIWTPRAFIAAVEAKFGMLHMDLAASHMYQCAPVYLTEKEDALSPAHRDWHGYSGPCWLNPPYAEITPWARNCTEQGALGAEILLLVPGSIGANWWWDYVEPFATVYSVGRMVFDNCFDSDGKPVTTPYAKDLALCHYDRGAEPAKMQRWQWKKDVPVAARAAGEGE